MTAAVTPAERAPIQRMLDRIIAGTRFSVSAHDGSLIEHPGIGCGQFLANGANRSPADVAISVIAGNLPDTGGMESLFSTGETWDLFRDGDRYCIVMRSPMCPDAPLWIAQFDRAITAVTVHLGELFVRDAGGYPELISPLSYPLDQLLLVMHLAARGGLLVHAAGMVHQGRAYVFPGRCSAGKSTITRLFMEQGAHFLSDDRIAIRNIDGEFHAFGTPWPGDAGIAVNESAPLAGIYFLEQGTTDQVATIPASRAVARLFPVTSIPWQDPDLADRAMHTCDALLRQVPSYDLSFRIGPEVVRGFHEFLGKPPAAQPALMAAP